MTDKKRCAACLQNIDRADQTVEPAREQANADRTAALGAPRRLRPPGKGARPGTETDRPAVAGQEAQQALKERMPTSTSGPDR